MQDRLTITLRDHPGEIVRVLALIERRRFELRDLRMSSGDSPKTIELQVRVSSDSRNIRSLTSQIEKLVAVLLVEHHGEAWRHE